MFGIQRIIKSLEPLNKKLSPDTWYHTKRCLVSYLLKLSKQIFLLTNDMFINIIKFLNKVEDIGQNIPSSIGQKDTNN